MRRSTTLGRLDPVDMSGVEQVSSSSVFEELRLEIVAMEPETHETASGAGTSRRIHLQPRQLRPVAVFAGVVALVLVIGLVVLGAGGGAPKSTSSTGQQNAGRPGRGGT